MDTRYSRQEIFKKIGKKSQKLLSKSSVIIVGIGALGSVIANLLHRAGIGKITLIDFDNVEVINFHRQLLFDESDIGRNKALCLQDKLKKINSEIKIISIPEKLNEENAERIIQNDLVIDCTDNIPARLLINKICKKKKIPLIHAAAIEDKGNVIFFENKNKNQPCLRCIYNENMPSKKCSEYGILNTITNAISSIATMSAIKYLIKTKIETEIIRFDVWDNTISKIKIKQNKKCPVCFSKKKLSIKSNKKLNKTKIDKKTIFEIDYKNINLNKLKLKLEKYDVVYNLGYGLSFKDMLIYSNGRVKIKAKSKKEADKLFKKYIS